MWKGIHLPSLLDPGSGVVRPASDIVIQNHQDHPLLVVHAEITWSVVCSVVPHSQFNKGVSPMCTWTNKNTQHRFGGNLSLTKAVPGKLIPRGLALALEMKALSTDVLFEYSMLHL